MVRLLKMAIGCVVFEWFCIDFFLKSKIMLFNLATTGLLEFWWYWRRLGTSWNHNSFGRCCQHLSSKNKINIKIKIFFKKNCFYYQLVVKFDLTATKLSATKPSSFWQRVQLEVDGLTSSDVSSSHDLVLSDVHLTIDESLSSEFRSDSARPSAPGGEEPSAAAHTTIASMIVAAVAFFQLF